MDTHKITPLLPANPHLTHAGFVHDSQESAFQRGTGLIAAQYDLTILANQTPSFLYQETFSPNTYT